MDKTAVFTNTPLSLQRASRLQAMPKIELHVHLEGATDVATIWELARRNNVALPAATLEEWQAMYTFRDFNHFIKIYTLAINSMQTPADFAFMTERFLAQQAQHNVKYSEVYLSASFMLDKFPPDEIFAALSEGARRGEEKYGTRLRFIPDIARHEPETSHRVLDFVLAGHEYGIFVGLEWAAWKLVFRPNYLRMCMLKRVVRDCMWSPMRVKQRGRKVFGVQSVALQAERIGHGVRSIEDAQLVAHLAQTQIPLEVSPYSNYRLKVVPTNRPHPIRQLVDQGVYVTVNSDDPPMFSTDISKEYQLLARQGFSWELLWKLNLNAIEASFLSEGEKAVCRAEWEAFLDS